MSAAKRGLGKGLGALIPADKVQEKKSRVEKDGSLVNEVDINLIVPNRDQPRKYFDKERLEALSSSIKEHGILQPIVLKKKDNYFEIIAGERRWRASLEAGLSKIPSIIKDVDDKTIAELAIIENLQRENLNSIEEAVAYQSLIDDYKISHENVAKLIGRSRVYVTNILRLLNLDDTVKEAIIENKISQGHGRALLALGDEFDRRQILTQIMDDQLSVRDTEKLIKEFYKERPIKTKPVVSPEVRHCEEDLSYYMGTKVKIKDKNGKGKLEIDYYDINDLNRIIELIKR